MKFGKNDVETVFAIGKSDDGNQVQYAVRLDASCNIVGADHEWISRQFSSKVADKFANVGWHEEVSGAPVLDDAHAWIDCAIHEEVLAGDHVIVVGRVLALGAAEEGGPLAYYRGGYGKFSSAPPAG